MKDWRDDILYDYAMRHVGKPALWAGNDGIAGMDCSGFVLELLKSCGQLPHKGDWTAQGLYQYFSTKGVHTNSCRFGSLVFYGLSTTQITHIAFGLDRFRVIEAGGSSKKVKTIEDAIKYDAWIRIRPVDFRRDCVVILKLLYGTIGAY